MKLSNLDVSASEYYTVADGMVIDEAGIDLLVDDEPVCAVSFRDVNPYELMYAVLPEDFDLPDYLSKNAWRERLGEFQEAGREAKTLDEGDFEQAILVLEVTIRGLLESLAVINDWEKQ